ncbi:MAG: hypothetical protein ACI3XL_01435 [Eubacteriales bacterium]
MKYKIKKIKSRRMLLSRAIFVACLLALFLAVALCEALNFEALPEWVYVTHKK